MSARILLVDDEPMNLALLEALLLPFGHELICAGNGREAIRLFDQAPPDLVLLDYVMPELDGVGVLRHIRARESGTHVPVVLVTAHSDCEHRLRGLEAGADEFLEKPIDSAVLMVRVKTLLSLKNAYDQLSRSKHELEERHRAVEQARREHKELTEFIVHDLKNPLSALCANLEFAQHTLTTSPPIPTGALHVDLIAAVDDGRVAAHRLTSMIADLLTISRMEDSSFSLHREGITVTSLLRSVVQSYVMRAQQKGIALDPPPALDIEIQADRALMMRVLEISSTTPFATPLNRATSPCKRAPRRTSRSWCRMMDPPSRPCSGCISSTSSVAAAPKTPAAATPAWAFTSASGPSRPTAARLRWWRARSFPPPSASVCPGRGGGGRGGGPNGGGCAGRSPQSAVASSLT